MADEDVESSVTTKVPDWLDVYVVYVVCAPMAPN